VAPRAAAADAHNPAGAAEAGPLGHAPHHPDVEQDDEQRRTEAEQKGGPGAAGVDRLRPDHDAVVDQELLEPRIDEGGQRGLEAGDLARLLPGPRRVAAGWRPGDRPHEAALDALALAEDGLDVARHHLLLEEGV